MPTSKLFSVTLIAAAALSSAGAFAGDNDYPVMQPNQTTSTLSRAEVRAAYLQAKREGTLLQSDDRYPVVTAEDTGKTRAEVRQELAEAQRDGSSTRIDNSYPSMEAGS